MRKWALLNLILVFSQTLFANSRPDWSLRTPEQDLNYRYYIGRASQLKSEAEAFRAARQNAIADLVLENFGFVTRVDSETTSTTQEGIVVNRVGERSQNIQIKEFEQIDSYFEKQDDHLFNLWVLFRYKKSAIAEEKLRLSKAGTFDLSDSVESGKFNLKFGTVLEVNSLPDGAEVIIDGERWGVTPLKIKGSLSPSAHTIILDHPDYVVENDQVNLALNQNQSIRKLLKRAYGYVTFKSDPEVAFVSGRNHFSTQTPTEEMKFLANDVIELKFENSKAESVTRSFRIGRDEHLTFEVTLPLKPAYFKWPSLNKETELYVDGHLVHESGGSIPSRFKVVPGETHEVCAQRVNYQMLCHTGPFDGDQTIVYSKPQFSKIQKREVASVPEASTSSASEFWNTFLDSGKTPYMLDIFVGFGGATLASRNENGFTQLGLSFKSAWLGPIGYEFGASFCSNDKGHSSSSTDSSTAPSTPVYAMNAYDLYVGIPVFIPISQRTRAMLTIEEGYVDSNFMPSASGLQAIEYTQSRTGIGGGFLYMPEPHGYGADIKLLYNNYSNSKRLKGESSGMIQFGFLFGFN